LDGHKQFSRPSPSKLRLTAILADSERPLGAQRAGQRLFSTRRLDNSLPSSSLALQLNPNFCWRSLTTVLGAVLFAALAVAVEAAQRALRLSPRDPFSATVRVAAYAQFVGKTTPRP